MKLNTEEIMEMEKIKRINLINSVSGIKPANLIGTVSNKGVSNLAIFSSVVHIGANPPLLGFILRPYNEIRRDTYQNIMDNYYYTINHIHLNFVEQAHYTSAKFEEEVSEFDMCRLNEEYIDDFPTPFVRESKIKMGMEFKKIIPIEINDTSLIIGKIKILVMPDEATDELGQVDPAKVNNVGVSGLNSYYSLKKIGQFPYARKEEMPDFSKL
jgi:flavin reductase (DIM6/NTAB) family NADH-FMN oxidoreductase RutF